MPATTDECGDVAVKFSSTSPFAIYGSSITLGAPSGSCVSLSPYVPGGTFSANVNVPANGQSTTALLPDALYMAPKPPESCSRFNQLMSQQPQTLAYALADSPVALLAWNAQLFGQDLDADLILTNVTLYWLTGTGGSAARLYYEDAHATPPTERTTVPTAVAAFGGDFSGIRWVTVLKPWSSPDQTSPALRGCHLPGSTLARRGAESCGGE